MFGTLTGSLMDALTNQGVPGATVVGIGTGRSTVTNPDGQFTISLLQPGQITFEFSKPGYKTTSRTFTILNGSNGPVTVRICPDVPFCVSQ